MVRAPRTHKLEPDAQPQPSTSEQSRPQVNAPQFGRLGAAAGAEVLQMPWVISEPVVRPPKMHAPLFVLQPHVASVAQSRPQVKREQPSVGAAVGAELWPPDPAQMPMAISESVVRPPEMQAFLFLLQPQPSEERTAQSRPHRATAHPVSDVVGTGVGIGVGSDVVGPKVVGTDVVGAEVGVGVGIKVGVGIGIWDGLDVVGPEVVGTDVVGTGVGVRVGVGVGIGVGIWVGSDVVGAVVLGTGVGIGVGFEVVGSKVGFAVGVEGVGATVGSAVGSKVVGSAVGSEMVGDTVGPAVGTEDVGDSVGVAVGLEVVGVTVGRAVGPVVVGDTLGGVLGAAVGLLVLGDTVGTTVGHTVMTASEQVPSSCTTASLASTPSSKHMSS